MPRPRTLLAVPCPTHGADPCPTTAGCSERRALAGLPPSKPSKARGTTGAERNRREVPLRDLRRGCAAAEDIRREDAAEALALLDAARRVVRRKMKEER